jgi:hypothetical protein
MARLRIPARFTCGDRVWRVTRVTRAYLRRRYRDLHDDGDELHGVSDYNTRRVYIVKGMPRELEERTWLHELGHVIRWSAGDFTLHDEVEIEAHAMLMRHAFTTAEGSL